MNSEVKHLIMIAVSLSITIAIMVLFLGLYQKYRKAYDIIEADNISVSQELKYYHITKYDGRNISGSDAVNYIKTIYKDVVVMYTQPIDETNVSLLRDDTSAVYISPTGLYSVDVKAPNGVPRTVTITER